MILIIVRYEEDDPSIHLNDINFSDFDVEFMVSHCIDSAKLLLAESDKNRDTYFVRHVYTSNELMVTAFLCAIVDGEINPDEIEFRLPNCPPQFADKYGRLKHYPETVQAKLLDKLREAAIDAKIAMDP